MLRRGLLRPDRQPGQTGATRPAQNRRTCGRSTQSPEALRGEAGAARLATRQKQMNLQYADIILRNQRRRNVGDAAAHHRSVEPTLQLSQIRSSRSSGRASGGPGEGRCVSSSAVYELGQPLPGVQGLPCYRERRPECGGTSSPQSEAELADPAAALGPELASAGVGAEGWPPTRETSFWQDTSLLVSTREQRFYGPSRGSRNAAGILIVAGELGRTLEPAHRAALTEASDYQAPLPRAPELRASLDAAGRRNYDHRGSVGCPRGSTGHVDYALGGTGSPYNETVQDGSACRAKPSAR